MANCLGWNIEWSEGKDAWYAWSGENTILKSDSRDAAEAFLYGSGLVYGVLPEDTFDRLEELVNRWL